MKDFNLHKFLRNNPLTANKKKINEAFEGFGGVRGIEPIREAPIKESDPWGFEDMKAAVKKDQQDPNLWIADIDRFPAYKGWTASWEHPGIILWSNPDVLVQVAATPGWDGEGTPIEIQYPTEDHVYGDATNDVIKVLDQDEFSGYDEYLNAIAPYLNSIAKKFAKSGEDTSMSEPFEEGIDQSDMSLQIRRAINNIVAFATLPSQIDYRAPYKKRAEEAEKFLMSLPDGEKYLQQAYDRIDSYSEEDPKTGMSAANYNDMFEEGINESPLRNKSNTGLAGTKTLFVMDYQSGKIYSKLVDANIQSEEVEDMLADEYGLNISDVYYMITDEPDVEDLDGSNFTEGAADSNDMINKIERWLHTTTEPYSDYEFDGVDTVTLYDDEGSPIETLSVSKDMKIGASSLKEYLGYASHSGDFGDDDSEFETPIQRMNNLVNQNNLKMFITGARGIMGDLLDDGFEPDEVYDFLIDTLRKVD